MRVVAFIIIAAVIAWVAVVAGSSDNNVHSASAPKVSHSSPPIEPPKVKLGRLDSSYGLLQGNFTLINENKFPIADAVVRCDVIAPSGSVIRQYKFTVYEVSRRTVRRPYVDTSLAYGRNKGKSVSCFSTVAMPR